MISFTYLAWLKDSGRAEGFDGMTLVKWSADDKIRFLQEFGVMSIVMIHTKMGRFHILEMKRSCGFNHSGRTVQGLDDLSLHRLLCHEQK